MTTDTLLVGRLAPRSIVQDSPVLTEPPPLPESLVVEVTRLDVQYGIQGSPNRCPIAYALKRTLEAAGVYVATINVGRRDAEVYTSPSSWLTYWHDSERFVVDFDKGHAVQPCAVTLRRIGR